MAITTEWTVPNTSRKGYSGLSSDNKGDITDAVAGAEFHETDTNDLYIYDGAGWNLVRNNGYTLVESQGENTVDVASTGSNTGIVALAVQDNTLSALGTSDGDFQYLRVDSQGRLHVAGTAGSTQYAIGTTSGATDTGTAPLAIRDDALGTLSDPEGDWVALRVDSLGRLWVKNESIYTDGTDNPSSGEVTVIGGYDGSTAVVMATDANGYVQVELPSVSASAGVPVVDANMVELGYSQSKTISTVTTLATVAGGSLPAGATMALIQALTQNIRWRDDGTNPSATLGMQLAAGDQFFYTGDLTAFKVIEETATAEINVSFYKQS